MADKEKESGSLVDEIKNAPSASEIQASSPIAAAETPKATEPVKEISKETPVVVPASPVVDSKASANIEAQKAAAEKAAKKAQKEEAKKQAKIEKKAKKAAEFQAKIEQCPKDYRPVTTGVFFWCALLCALPVLGIIFTIIFSLIPRNKNFKNFARALLAWYVIALIVFLIFAVIATFVMGQSITDFIWPFEKFFSDMASALGF